MKRALLFFLAACGSQSPNASSHSDEIISDAASLASDDDDCPVLQQLQLTAGEVSDTSGNALLTPGELIYATITMKHLGETELISAPKLVAQADAPAQIDDSEWYFGIAAGDTLRFTLPIRLSHAVQPGSVVTLSVVPSAAPLSCSKLTPLQVQLPIAASCERQATGEPAAGCEDVAHLSVSDFRIEGTPAPGAQVTLIARLNELNGVDWTTQPSIFFGASEGETQQSPVMLYGIFGCDSHEMRTVVTFPSDWEPKRTLFWAQLGRGAEECTEAFSPHIVWNPPLPEE